MAIEERIVKALEEVGGKRWTKGSMDRVYFDGLAAWYGLTTDRYNSGNIAGAWLNGQEISNSKARKIVDSFAYSKVWCDVTDGRYYGKGIDTDDLNIIVNAINAAVKAALAAEQKAS